MFLPRHFIWVNNANLFSFKAGRKNKAAAAGFAPYERPLFGGPPGSWKLLPPLRGEAAERLLRRFLK